MATVGEFELAEMAKIASLTELVARMPRGDPRFALFLGAGASVTSGIPAAGALMGAWRRTIFRDLMGFEHFTPRWQTLFELWTHWDAHAGFGKQTLRPRPKPDNESEVGRADRERLDQTAADAFGPLGDRVFSGYPAWRHRALQVDRHPSEYALLFSRAYPDEDSRQGFIEALCDGAEPCAGYVYLASLVRDNIFRTLLTTNFDDLIHDAIFRYSGLKPAVCAFDSQVATIRMVAPRPKVIKLHGDFMYSSIRNVGTETARLDVNMRQKFEQTCLNYGLIVLGYSGQDRSVMDPIRSMLTQPGHLRHGLHWGVFVPRKTLEAGHGKVDVPEEVALLHRTYPDRVHLYAVGTFDEVMGAMARSCDSPPPIDLTQPESRSNYARLREAITNAEQSWRLEPQFRAALTSFRKAQSRPLHPAVELLDEADAVHIDANAVKARAADPDAKSGLRAADRVRILGTAMAGFERVDEICSDVLRRAGMNSAEWLEDPGASDAASIVSPTPAVTPVADWRDEYLIWAYRRRSGGRTGTCEALYASFYAGEISAGEDPNQRADALMPESQRLRFLESACGAWSDCECGWKVARAQGFPTAVVGHTRNFAYNGLLSMAYLVRMSVDVPADQRARTLEWLNHLTADRAFGQEYLSCLSTEIGGQALLSAAAQWAEVGSPWSTRESPPAGHGTPAGAFVNPTLAETADPGKARDNSKSARDPKSKKTRKRSS